MKSGKIVPCIWMDTEAEEAADFYTRTFSKGRTIAVTHYPASMENPGGKPPGSVLTVEVEVEGQRFTLLNGGPAFKTNPSISFFVRTGSVGEASRLCAALAQGGKELMPLGTYPWSERYGWVQDRFGVSWQVMAEREPGEATILPCLMFSGAVGGKAEEAMETYARIFPGSEVQTLARYEEGEGPKGWIKHGRFRLAGQDMVAMDSHMEHGFGFNEGMSLQVMCSDQGEIDHFWNSLSEGGKPSVCGWLQDRYGVSWQVVPKAMDEWMTSEDVPARDRAFAAMLEMKKLDVGALERAFAGR